MFSSWAILAISRIAHMLEFHLGPVAAGFVCNSYITGCMAFIVPKPEGTCVRELRSINAIHPEYAWYNYFISRGHDYHGKNRKKEETSLSGSKQSYKVTLLVSSRTSIDLQIVSWLRGVVKLMPSSLARHDKHIEFRIWERCLSCCLSAARAVAYPTRIRRKATY